MDQHENNSISEKRQLRLLLRECKNESVDSYAYFQQTIVPRYSNKSEFYHLFNVSHDDKVMVISLLSLIGLVGFTLNLIQLVYIIRRIRAKRKLAMDYFLISLTVGDLYKSGPSVPILAILCYKGFDWAMFDAEYSDVMCKMYVFSGAVARTVGLSSMCIIAIARLVAIRWPMVVKRMKLSSAVTGAMQAALVWVLVVIVCAPMIYTANTDVWTLTPNETILGEHPELYYPVYVDDPNTPDSCAKYKKFCTYFIEGTLTEMFWLTVVLFIIIPQTILITCYTLIVYTLVMRRKQRKLTFKTRDSSFMAFMNKHDREAITSAVLGSVYSLLSLPMLIYMIAKSLITKSNETLDVIYAIVAFLEFSTVVTNPLIYTFLTPSFVRREKIFCRRIYLTLSSRNDEKFSAEENSGTELNNEVTGIVSLKYKLLVAGLNRRVTAFVDVQGTEGTAKVWEKKHEEDIQAMAYHHPNVLVTASYDGDIIIWSTETNQPACRMNCQESSKPMMGGERHKKMDSQRTLIAKNFNKGRIVSEPFPHAQRRALHFIDEEADDEKTEVIDSPVLEWSEWSRKPPAELTGSIAEESSYVSVASEVKTKTRNSIGMENVSPQKCSNCFGFVVDANNEVHALSLNIKAEQLCCCVESDHPPRLSGKHTTLEVGGAKMNSSEERNLGSRGHPKPSERFMDDPIWQLRNTTAKQRKSLNRSLSSITETPVDPVAIRGPQALITTTSIECLAVLNKRKVERKTAAVFAGGLDGWIRAWSLHYKGGLMGQFRGSSQPGAAVTCMAVDDKNHHLFAGDAKGYIMIWYVGDYCTKTPYTSTLSQEVKDAFIRKREKTYQRFLSWQFFERFEAEEDAIFRESASRPPTASNPEKTVHSPVLLARFRGHLKAVTCIEFASCYSMVITGSEDHNIRVWSMAGRYIGQLGNNTWPRIQQTGNGWIDEMSEFSLPADVKRVATPRTLRVFNGGLSKRWKLVRNGIMMLVGPWVRMNEEKESAKARFSSPSKLAGRVASPHIKLLSLSKEDLSAPDIENTHETGSSKILGKSYRKVGGHKAFPVYSSLFGPGNAMQVWMKLKTSELENVKEGAERPPPEVLEMRNKRRSKYINQLIKARAARKLLAESVLAGTFKRFSGDDIPPERVLTISTGVDQNKPLTKLSPRFRNPFLPSRASDRRPRSKSKSSRHNQQPETVTIDKLSLEICEIMGEANEN